MVFFPSAREGQDHYNKTDALSTGAAGRGGGDDGLCGGGLSDIGGG